MMCPTNVVAVIREHLVFVPIGSRVWGCSCNSSFTTQPDQNEAYCVPAHCFCSGFSQQSPKMRSPECKAAKTETRRLRNHCSPRFLCLGFYSRRMKSHWVFHIIMNMKYACRKSLGSTGWCPPAWRRIPNHLALLHEW